MSILWVPFTAYLVTLNAACDLLRPFQWRSSKERSHYLSLVYSYLRWHFCVRQAVSEIHLLLVPYRELTFLSKFCMSKHSFNHLTRVFFTALKKESAQCMQKAAFHHICQSVIFYGMFFWSNIFFNPTPMQTKVRL